MNILCSAKACPVLLSSACVFYEGENLIYSGINTNDNLQVALQKIDDAFGNAILGISAILPISVTIGPNPIISISQSSATINGYLSSVDWNIFNNKQNAITLTTVGSTGASTFNSLSGALNIPDYSGAFSGFVPTSRQLTINGVSYDLSANRTWNVGTVTSVGITMPSAFNVSNSPITGSGTIAITAAGLASQYVRGDGVLGDFPSNGGGGSSVSYYLNGSVNQGTFGGSTYYEMNRTPVIGGPGVNFSITNTVGLVSQFITDPLDPGLLLIPAGNWNIEFYFNASDATGAPYFYVELYVYNGVTFTLISSGATNPEYITNGTSTDVYYTSIAVPETILTVNDRLAIRVYGNTNGNRTITLHTEDDNLSQIVTTFSNGLTALNGLTRQVQYFATGTTGVDFNISSSVDIHTFNLPTASASNRGALSTADWTIFNNKQNALTLTTTGTSGASTLIGATLNIPQYQAALTNPVTGTGVTGQVAYWNGTGSQTGSNNLFWDAANARLGIGTNAPVSDLNIFKNTSGSSTAIVLSESWTTGNFSGLVLNYYNTGFTTNQWQSAKIAALISAVQSNGLALVTNNGGNIAFWSGASATEKMRLFGLTGNLVLQNGGTFTDGGQRLQVQGTTLLNGAVSVDAGASNDAITFLNSGFLRMGTTRFRATGAQFQFQDNLYADKVVLSTNGSFSFFNNGVGNYAFGGSTDGGQRLQVYGDAFIKGSGATSATNGLLVQNSASTQQMILNNAGQAMFGANPPSANVRLETDGTFRAWTRLEIGQFGTAIISTSQFLKTASGSDYFEFANNGTHTATGGTYYFLQLRNTINPTSGTGVFNALNLNLTINQTGGANGITRGLYVNPTLTAAADWRSIETSTGKVLFNKDNAGNIQTDYTLNIKGNNPRLRIEAGASGTGNGDAVIQFADSAGDNWIIKRDNSTLALILGYGWNNSLQQVLTLGIRSSDPTAVVRAASSSTTDVFLAKNFSGTDLFSIRNTGNILVNTSTDAGYKLDVNGTARVSDNLLVQKNQNAATTLSVINATSGTAAQSQILLQCSGATDNFVLGKFSPTTTPFSYFTSGDAYLYSYEANLNIATDSSTKQIRFGNVKSTASPAMTLTAAGNFLVGTTTDQGYRVQITGSGDNMLNVWGATSPSIRLANASSGATQGFALGLATATNNFIQGSVLGDVCITTATASPILFGMWQTINASEVMRISTSNNLLIGTNTDAGYRLDVNGTARVSGLLRGDADAQLRGLYPYLQFLPSGWSGGSTLIQAGVNLVGTTVGDYTLITTPANKGYAFYSGSTIPLLIETTTQNVVLNGLASSGYRLYINRGSSATGALAVVGGVSDFAGSTTSYASLRINSGVAPTSPNNGEIWFDGTDLKIRIGGLTKTVTVT